MCPFDILVIGRVPVVIMINTQSVDLYTGIAGRNFGNTRSLVVNLIFLDKRLVHNDVNALSTMGNGENKKPPIQAPFTKTQH